MKKYIVLMAIATAILLSLMLTGCATKTEVDLAPYIGVRYQGNNGTATAVFDFDYAEFEYAVMSQWDRSDDNFDNLADLTALELTMNCQPASLENLSNDDVIQVTVSYDEALAKELGYVFKDVHKTFTVEGLREAILVDPFDPNSFCVEVTGFSPKLSVTVRNTAEAEDPLRRVQYTLDKEWDLRNGDTVTITAGFMPGYNMDAYALSRREMTVTIEGMDCYLTDPAALKPEDVQAIREKALAFYANEKYMDILCENASQVSLSEENRQRAGAPEFSEEGYAVLETYWGTDSTLILPFQMFVEDARFEWWDGAYQDPVLVQDLQLYGCFRISGLHLTTEGDLIREGEFGIRMDDLYMSREALEQTIQEAYDAETLVAGSFQS